MSQKKTVHVPFNTYQRTDVLTANRETILLMMYAGAIRALKSAIHAHEQSDQKTRNEKLLKAQDIINELRATINHEAAEDLAKQLDELYGFILQRILQASVENKVEFLQEVLGILETLHTAWAEAISKLRKDADQTTS